MRPNLLSTITLALFGLSSLLLLAVGQETIQTKVLYRPTGSEATITGTIVFDGEVPKRQRIDTSADAVCERLSPKLFTENAIVNHGKLENAFVYIKSGDALDFYSFETPTAYAHLSHQGCRYEPHLLGVQVGQTIMISSADPTHHNTHPNPRYNAEWNQTQAPGAPPIEKRFNQPEAFIPFKDNQHPWEKAYVGVFSHPFFAISDERGNYRIEGLPPGHYSLVAWHERFGERTMEITIRSGELQEIDFSFSPTSSAP